jgi:hypothetical protein
MYPGKEKEKMTSCDTTSNSAETWALQEMKSKS